MALNIRDLCRLCAKKEEFTKDLFDVNNAGALKLIKDLVQITINENDELPTKVCINCEEKLVSFQLFILECYKAQDNLSRLYLENSKGIRIKPEADDCGNDYIISEVKDELLPEDIGLNISDKSIIEEDEFNDYSNYCDDIADNENEDYMDNVTLAALKKVKINSDEQPHIKEKRRYTKKKNNTSEDSEEMEKVLQKSDLKVKDFVKSKSVLYKHVSDHKIRNRKNKSSSGNDGNDEADSKYSNLKIKDFVAFTCSVCQRKYSSWYSLKAHTESTHKIAPVVQCVCGITLKSKSVLYKHIQDHKNPNMLCCDKCPRITKTIEALNKHKMRHVPKSERQFVCSTCSKIFVTKDALKSHERSHIPIEDRKIYHCDVCDLKFTTRSSAQSHKRVVHDKIKSYVCDLCGYACGTNGELRQHRAIHSDDKPFVCKTCSKPFKTHSNLKTHMDTHEDTSYQCYVCNRVLNSRRTLRKHLLVHEEKCRHVCSFCHKAFKRRQTLKVHLYTHTGDKPLTCKWCDERFAYASTLRSHRLRCHPDKMAAQAINNSSYTTFHMPREGPPDYIKNDIVTITGNISKDDVETMQN